MKTPTGTIREFGPVLVLKRILRRTVELFWSYIPTILISYVLVLVASIVAKHYMSRDQFDALTNLVKSLGTFWRF